jgi:type VI secretion system secreted protein Hcp
MAVDIFLKLDPIKGESLDEKCKDQIDVLSWSFGESQSGTFHSGSGGGAGKVNVQDLHFTHFVDKATPELFKVCAKGTHIPSALLTVRKAGDKPLDYLTIEMENVLVSSVSTGGSHGDDRIVENVSLNFRKLKMIYRTQTDTGAGGKSPTFGWDIPANKPWGEG